MDGNSKTSSLFRSESSTIKKRPATINRQTFNSLDAARQEERTRIIDQEIHALGEVAHRKVYALLRAGHEVDTVVRALAGPDRE